LAEMLNATKGEHIARKSALLNVRRNEWRKTLGG
jgi:hypothetical protein